MALSLEDLRFLIARMDPFQPLEAGSELYVPFDEGNHARGDCGCIERLERTIQLSSSPTCQLFTGFPGSGKTTELKRLAARFRQNKSESTHVLLVDFEEYVDRHSPIAISDILRVLAFSLDRDAAIAEGKNPELEPGYLRRFWDYLTTTDVELKTVGLEAYGSKLMFELKRNPPSQVILCRELSRPSPPRERQLAFGGDRRRAAPKGRAPASAGQPSLMLSRTRARR
jgi:hypothetical protein